MTLTAQKGGRDWAETEVKERGEQEEEDEGMMCPG